MNKSVENEAPVIISTNNFRLRCPLFRTQASRLVFKVKIFKISGIWHSIKVIAQWTSWTDWSDCFVNPLNKYMSVSSRTRSCLCDDCTIYCTGPTVERKKCADIGHCRQYDQTATLKSTSCPISKWSFMTEACTCPIGILHQPHPNFLGNLTIFQRFVSSSSVLLFMRVTEESWKSI